MSTQSQWLVVSEAAKQLDVSDSTVRRRAGRGELRSRRSPEGVLEVQVQVESDSAQDAPPQNTEPQPATTSLSRPTLDKKYAHLATATPPAGDDLSLDTVSVETQADRATEAHALTEPTAAAARHDEPADEPQETTPYPSLTMADITPPAEGQEESEVRRFQRLAGASLVVAQRQTDEANEKLAIVRNELHRARRWGQGTTAAAIFCAVMLCFSLVSGGSEPREAAASNEVSPAQQQALKQQERELKQTREALNSMQKELTESLTRLQQMQANLSDQAVSVK